MSQSEDFGLICTIAGIKATLVGRKLRVVGKLLAYDPLSQLIILAHPPHGLLVDITLCLDPSQSLMLLNERKGTIMVLGTLEQSEVSLDTPNVFKFSENPVINNRLVLRAILIKGADDISLEQWERGVLAMRQVTDSK